MHEDEVTEEELFGEDLPEEYFKETGHPATIRSIDEGLFFRTRVEVAMRVHNLSPTEAVDYVSERSRMTENGDEGGCHIAPARHRIRKARR